MLTTNASPTKWARALHRATAHHLIIVPMDTITDGPNETLYFKARSVSRPDTTVHGIRIDATSAGISVQCSCEGGQQRLACMHAAQALRYAGLLPDIELIETPEPLPAAA